MSYELDPNYNDVPSRIAEFREKYPTGTLQQASLEFREVADKWWVVYTAAAYRTPDDERPGHGTAWEPVPGKTPYTRDSELQNAETAAWGRAIVAALAADTKRGIASAEEVRNRKADSQVYDPAEVEYNDAKAAVKDAWNEHAGTPFDLEVVAADFQSWAQGELLANADAARLREYAAHLEQPEANQ